MQWFDAIMTMLATSGTIIGIGIHVVRKEDHRHKERMAESERRHDRFMQQLKAISNAKNQSAIQRIKNMTNEWQDWEF